VYFCLAVSVTVVPSKRTADANAVLSDNERKEFPTYFQDFIEPVRKYFKEKYDLCVTDIDKDKVNCKIHSLRALDNFWYDLENGSAITNFEQELLLRESETAVRLHLSAHDYNQAKELLAKLDSEEPEQM